MSDEYTTVRHTSQEMAAIARLHNHVFDSWGERAREQLRWKYVENPAVDDVTVMTARTDGDIVGMLGMMPQRVTVNGESVLSFQAADAAVRADHRRNGLLSRMFETFLSYADGTDARLCTGFTNEPATRAFVEQGWTRTERDRHVYLTPELSAPAALTAPRTYPAAVLRLVHAGAVSTLPAVARRLAGERAADDRTVERFDDPPVERLAALYATAVPDHAHTTRSTQFYTWRLNEPRNTFRTYVLFEHSEPVCGLVTSRTQGTVLFRDVVPLAGARPALLSRLVAAAMADQSGADRFVALDGFPETRVLLRNGFLPPLLNPFTPTTRRFITRPLPADEPSVNGLDITASEHWSPLHIERDF